MFSLLWMWVRIQTCSVDVTQRLKNAPVAVPPCQMWCCRVIDQEKRGLKVASCLPVCLFSLQWGGERVLRMPIKPVMVRSLSRRADDWQAWQAGWVVHVVALINCRRLGNTWADGANMEVNGEQNNFFCETKGEKLRQIKASLLSDRMKWMVFFFFLFHAIDLRSTICCVLQSGLSERGTKRTAFIRG